MELASFKVRAELERMSSTKDLNKIPEKSFSFRKSRIPTHGENFLDLQEFDGLPDGCLEGQSLGEGAVGAGLVVGVVDPPALDHQEEPVPPLS